MPPHQKILLSRSVRIGIMSFLTASFFVISPLIILYTIGYRYDVTTGIVRETGVLSIDAAPNDADIFLDTIHIDKKFPIRLTNLIPNTYQLTIQKDGYYPWEKELVIERKQTTYIRDITLFRKETLEQIMDVKKPIIQAESSYDGNFLLITAKEDNIYEIILLNTRTNEQRVLVRTAADQNPTTEWSTFSRYGVIKITREQTSLLYLFSAEAPDTIRSYTYHTDQENFPHQWPITSSEPTLYIQEGTDIYRLTLSDNIRIGSTETDIWYVDENNLIWYTQNGHMSIVNTKQPEDILYQTNTPIQEIIAVKNKYVLLKNEQAITILARDKDQLKETVTLGTQAIRYNRNTEEWISWSPWEIWNIYEDGSTAFLNRVGEHIVDVWPLDQFGVLLLVRNDSLVAFNPGYFVRQTLLEKTNAITAGVDTEQRAIYIYSPEDSIIKRLRY